MFFKIITASKQKEIDRKNLRKIMFAIQAEAKNAYPRQELKEKAESIYYTDDVVLFYAPDKITTEPLTDTLPNKKRHYPEFHS